MNLCEKVAFIALKDTKELSTRYYNKLLLSAKTSSLACTCMHAHASLEK